MRQGSVRIPNLSGSHLKVECRASAPVREQEAPETRLERLSWPLMLTFARNAVTVVDKVAESSAVCLYVASLTPRHRLLAVGSRKRPSAARPQELLGLGSFEWLNFLRP
jgi:hypothetical protein